jgi:Flp pilus assembly pilin Flp
MRSRCQGQGLVEYGLILIFVAFVCVVLLTVMGISVSTMFGTVANLF